MSIPKALSVGEELFAHHCQAYKIMVHREWQFLNDRKWRFDFAIPIRKIAVEIEGGTWTGGRHSRGKGMEADCVKYAEAVLAGWKVFRFTTDQVISGYAIDTLRRALV